MNPVNEPTHKRQRVIDPTAKQNPPNMSATTKNHTKPEEKPPFKVWTLGELRKQEEPQGWNLVGDYHVTRGSITVLAGSPGIGKSFATLMLAIQGAIGSGNWLGYTINTKFKTLIVQSENSLLRLILDAKRVEMPDMLDDHVKLLEFEWGNISLGNSKLVDALRNLIAEFEPDLVVLDPWNQFADDDKAKETKAAMDGIKHILDAAEKPPACLIVAHHRKKREGDAHKGRQMADLISGSYVMQSNPRCVLCYVAFDPSDENDNRVVMLCPKKNNGKHKGPATAWTLCENGFEAMPDFDYKAWQDGGTDAKESKAKIRLEHLQEIFKAGALTRAEAGKKLEALTGAGRSAVSEALTKRFADMIEIIGGGLLLTLRDEYKPGASPFEDDD
jgi:hypothetical protein